MPAYKREEMKELKKHSFAPPKHGQTNAINGGENQSASKIQLLSLSGSSVGAHCSFLSIFCV